MKNNGSVCIMGKYHDILYVGMKLCYDWQLKDAETVANLLKHVYLCEKTFERILIGAIFGIGAPHFVAGWKSDFRDQEENVNAMIYFLQLATEAKLEFSVADERDRVCTLRFVDVPIESCGRLTALKITIHLGLPDKLHVLLRFGASIDVEVDGEDTVEVLLEKLERSRGHYPYNFVNCLQLILRALPAICICCPEARSDLVTAAKFYKLVKNGVVPLSRCGIVPVELKHLCRCAIRRVLWKNFQLPNGIRTLSIPDCLRNYLDLLQD